MNLWQKPIDQITFDDVDEFCAAGLEESVRLDYKAEWPGDLAKTMAAMANTVGGMIIIGVDADKTTNKPIWPPQKPTDSRAGFRLTHGQSERVYQNGRDAIFPPLMPEVSTIMENKRLPGHAILVIRVPESKDAPHAVEGKKKVYIYERTGNQGYAHSLADLDYIERLFSRRQRIEAEREKMIEAAIERSTNRIGLIGQSYRWASVIPFYPWRPVATAEACHKFHTKRLLALIARNCADSHYQRVPNGSFGTYFDQNDEGSLIPVGCSSISDKGHFFGITIDIEHTHKSSNSPTPAERTTVDYELTENLIHKVIMAANEFYTTACLDQPAYLKVSLGIENARDLMLVTHKPNRHEFRFHGNKSRFPDSTFRVDSSILQSSATPRGDRQAPPRRTPFRVRCSRLIASC